MKLLDPLQRFAAGRGEFAGQKIDREFAEPPGLILVAAECDKGFGQKRFSI